MADTPFPYPKETRETDILIGTGVAEYGPFGFKIFDTADVVVLTKPAGEALFSKVSADVSKVSGASFDDFTIDFGENIPPETQFIVRSERVHEREIGVTKGGAISTVELEKELSKQGTVIEELRRDVNRSFSAPFGTSGITLPYGTANSPIVWDETGKGIGNGPTPGNEAEYLGWSNGRLVNKSIVSIDETLPAVANTALVRRDDNSGFDTKPVGATGLSLLETSSRAQALDVLGIPQNEGHVVPVADRTALRALDATKNAVAYLKESGRKGIFVWRVGDYSTEIAADTLEGIFIKSDSAAATAGAWVRSFDGALCFHWFGAVGDGITDDQPAIQAAIDTVQALGGGRLVGRVGAHRCADTVTVSGTAPITIQGATAAIPAFGESGDTDSSFTLVFDVADGTDGVVFENASTRIDGASLKDVFIYRNTLEAITGTGLTGGRGLKVLGVVNPRFENVHIHNFAIDFEVSDIAAGPTSGGSFDKIRCSTAARMQALIRGAIDVSFNDCIFGGREGGNTYNGLLTWSDHSRRPNACHFTNCMFIESGGVRPSNNLRIVNGFWNHFTNCVFERANDQHIRVIYDVALGGSIIGAIFTGCHSNDPSITSVLIDGEVSNIHLLNSRWHQSNAGASPNACVRIEHASKALTSHKILGCQIRFETYGGIRINNAQGVIVSNNSIYGSGAGDGIILHSNSEKCIATQNVFSGVGTAVNNIGTGNVVADYVTI